MSERRAIGGSGRTIAFGALIALSLLTLAMVVTARKLTPDGAPLSRNTADFIVSSARDAGPGTLRDAILAADRLSTRAHIVITAPRIVIETALPALVNPHGVDIDAAAVAGIVDAARQESGAALQINSPGSLRGIHFVNAHGFALVVNAPDVELDSVTVSGSKVGVLLSAKARDCIIRTSTFERNETGVLSEADIRHVLILSSLFRGNTRAGFWLVAAPTPAPSVAPAAAEPSHGRERMRISDSVFEKNGAGVVVANQETVIQKSRFLGNRDSAVLILGGAAQLLDSELRDSGAAAVSVTSGTGVILARNTLTGNSSGAISVRDSDVVIESNTLTNNGLGIVSIMNLAAWVPVIRDNLISASHGDAITVIGGAPLLQRNRLLGNHGAAVRALDLLRGTSRLKAEPRLEANIFRDNTINTPVVGVYQLSGVP